MDRRGEGEKVLCVGTAARPQQRSAMKDAHFTVLGFTAAEGTPVMCAIIFAAKELELSWVQGLNPFVEWHHDNEDDFNLNTGKGKRYPAKGSCVCVKWKACAHFVLLFGIRKHYCRTVVENVGPNGFFGIV